MAISAAGIIFSNLNNNTLSRLTADRTVAAIPFACRYRLVDFSLSNMVNANISNINIVVNYNYRSLVEHIGSGKDWDLARREKGITIISPYQTATTHSTRLFSTHMEALKNMREYINEFKEEYVVMSDCDHVVNIDLKEVINAHEATGAAITFVTQRVPPTFRSKSPRMMISSLSGRITDIAMCSYYTDKNPELSLNIFVMKTVHLRKIVEEASAHSLESLTAYLLSSYKQSEYRSFCYDGYVASVCSFSDYYNCSMELINNEKARASLLWKKSNPIFTRIHNSSPAIHLEGGISKNSMLADECIIEGTVINSVLFRGVRVEKGAVVKNSVLFHGTHIGKGAEVNCIVTDKDVYVTDGVKLSGNENMPFYVRKNRKI